MKNFFWPVVARLLIARVAGGNAKFFRESWYRKAQVCYTTKTKERGAGVIARDAGAAGVEVVLVVVGDGTVSEVARELVHKPGTLGILPIGTFNNIARSIGVPADLPVATNIIATGHESKIDAGLANDTHYFFEAAGTGLDATLFPVGEEIKSGRWTPARHGQSVGYQIRIIISTLSHIVQAARMSAGTLAGTTIRRTALLVVTANSPYFGGGFAVAAGACSKWELLRHFHSISQGRYRYSPKIETFSAEEIELASPNVVAMHIDEKARVFAEQLLCNYPPAGLAICGLNGSGAIFDKYMMYK